MGHEQCKEAAEGATFCPSAWAVEILQGKRQDSSNVKLRAHTDLLSAGDAPL